MDQQESVQEEVVEVKQEEVPEVKQEEVPEVKQEEVPEVKQEEVLEEEFNLREFNWHRACLTLHELADELRIRYSVLQFCNFQTNCALLHHEALLKGVKRQLAEGDDEKKGENNGEIKGENNGEIKGENNGEIKGENNGEMMSPLCSELDLDFGQDSREIENSGRLTVSDGEVPEEDFGEPKN